MASFLKMGNYRIGTRLNIGFLQVILLTLLVGVVALYEMSALGHLVNELYDHPLTVGYTARDIRADAYAIHSLMRRVPLAGNAAELRRFESGVDDIESQIGGKFDILEKRFLGKKEDVLTARKAFADWKKLRDEQFELIRTAGIDKIDSKSFYQAQQVAADDLRDKMQAVVDFADWKAKDFIELAETTKAHAKTEMITLIIATLLLGLLISFLITRSITHPLGLIVRRMKDIAGGDLGHDLDIVRKDEVGALAGSFRDMQAGLRDKSEAASSIAAGDFSRTVEISGPKDLLGNAINAMTASLRSAKRESDLQDWVKTGKNELNRIIVGEKDVNVLAKDVIGFLAGYLGAQIGTLYLASGGGVLTLSGCYAFSKRKSLGDSIEPGEGLVGQAAIEGDLISITNIPEDYIRINSSFGDSPPRNIVAVPFLFENTVKGVMEIGSFQEFTDEKLGFLRDISGLIAIAFNTVQNQTRLRQLLEQTQRQATQLQVQEEELRTANEELEEQTMSLRQSEETLKQQQEELRVINEELEEKNDYLEKQKGQIAEKNLALEDTRHELERRAGELEKTGKYKSEFLANMSHELRTPLNSLLLLSRDLSENSVGNLTAEQVESAKIIRKSGMELLQLIDEVLDLSKIEAGSMPLKVREVFLKDVAEYVERGFKHLAAEKDIVFKIVMDDTLPEAITTDRQRLEQILKNLLSNAFKFTDQGSITVKFHRPAAGVNLSKSALRAGRAVAFSVKDTGVGIPDDKQMQIFEAFQQVDGGTTRKYGGTGLGLSISRQLAKLLGGEIQLASHPGEGSYFTLFLPLDLAVGDDDRTVPAEKREVALNPSVSLSAGRSVTSEYAAVLPSIPDDREQLREGERVILIIEDDANFAKILLNECHAKGFKALTSATGETGLGLAEKYLPAAIILDIKLPGMNGWTVLNALKANHATRHIPVHVMSVQEASLDAMQNGAIGFLTKPVSREGLDDAFEKIEVMVEKKIKDLLIVEDNDQQRLCVGNLISDADVHIVEAESGAAALAALRERDFDCVILDLGLPDMSGFELLKAMEEEEGIRVPPVIVYTGKDLSREEEMELRKHAESIIIKGVRSEDRLLDEVALFLHKTVSSMPDRKRQMIINLHDRDVMFEGKTILLVDDDMRNLFALSKILSERGMSVIKAEDGKKALAILEKNPDIDLVLLDIMMPVMDGYETARAIRAQPRFHRLPIITLTAKAMKDDRDKCIAAGASDYLSKPVEVDRLLSMLRVWLYKRSGY
ncbi:MAG: response regulator [Syntrophobacteraceae bacterium]